MGMAKSRHQIASEIAESYTREGTGYADRLYQLAYAIEAALKERDERAAKIAVDAFFSGWPMHYTNLQKGACVAAAIRNEDTNATGHE